MMLILPAIAGGLFFCATDLDAPRPEGNAIAVSDLIRRGARRLSDDEIEALVVGRTIRLTDLRSGEKYDIFFGEDGTRTIIDTVTSAYGGSTGQVQVNQYRIKDNKLHCSTGGRQLYFTEVYLLDNCYYGARSDEDGIANYEILGMTSGRVTIDSLLARGGVHLTGKEFRELIVGKTLTIRHMVTGETFEINFSPNGTRTLSGVEIDEDFHSTYSIVGDRLEIEENGIRFSAKLYRLGVRYYGARSQESVFISYEILATRDFRE